MIVIFSLLCSLAILLYWSCQVGKFKGGGLNQACNGHALDRFQERQWGPGWRGAPAGNAALLRPMGSYPTRKWTLQSTSSKARSSRKLLISYTRVLRRNGPPENSTCTRISLQMYFFSAEFFMVVEPCKIAESKV